MTYPNYADAILELQAWATPAPGITLTELLEEMRLIGNQVLEVDVVNNRLKVLHVTQNGLLGG